MLLKGFNKIILHANAIPGNTREPDIHLGSSLLKHLRSLCLKWWNLTPSSMKGACSHPTSAGQQTGSRAHFQTSKDIWLRGWVGMVSGVLDLYTNHGPDTPQEGQILQRKQQSSGRTPASVTPCKARTPCLLNSDAPNAYYNLVSWMS